MSRSHCWSCPVQQGYVVTESQERIPLGKGRLVLHLFWYPGWAHSGHSLNCPELAVGALEYSVLGNSIWSTVRGGWKLVMLPNLYQLVVKASLKASFPSTKNSEGQFIQHGVSPMKTQLSVPQGDSCAPCRESPVTQVTVIL